MFAFGRNSCCSLVVAPALGARRVVLFCCSAWLPRARCVHALVCVCVLRCVKRSTCRSGCCCDAAGLRRLGQRAIRYGLGTRLFACACIQQQSRGRQVTQQETRASMYNTTPRCPPTHAHHDSEATGGMRLNSKSSVIHSKHAHTPTAMPSQSPCASQQYQWLLH